MPVGTRATVKALDNRDLVDLNAQIILGNTYHLYLRPGHELVGELGGIHGLMGWQRPVLTDSGGFQVFSLGDQVKIQEDGVGFTSHLDGSKHFFTPTKSIAIQQALGADIIMAFDECTPDQATASYARQALGRTHRWAVESVDAWEAAQRRSQQGNYQALFGIVQGAMIPELRRESAEFMAALPFDGIAVGGETIGYNMPGTTEVMNWIETILPPTKPRYAMGLGLNPQDLVEAVLAGFDMFDCVAPTRLARNGALYVGELVASPDANGQPSVQWSGAMVPGASAKGRLSIGNQHCIHDTQPIQVGCGCYTCQTGYSRAYLHHLYKADELTYHRLASIHNVYQLVRLSQSLRHWVLTGQVPA